VAHAPVDQRPQAPIKEAIEDFAVMTALRLGLTLIGMTALRLGLTLIGMTTLYPPPAPLWGHRALT
jgi:hypothetical protein